jgi:hypothetical protein
MAIGKRSSARKSPNPRSTHSVSLSIPSEIDIGQNKRAASFTVKKGRTLVGTVVVSEGAISWTPAYSRRPPIRKNWKQFEELMTD